MNPEYLLFSTVLGTLYVVDDLDYEQIKEYALTIRATDSLSGIFAEVLVNVLVTDVNDCPPEFPHTSYNVTVSEAASFGSFVLRVTAEDRDTGNHIYVSKFLDWRQIGHWAPVHKNKWDLK